VFLGEASTLHLNRERVKRVKETKNMITAAARWTLLFLSLSFFLSFFLSLSFSLSFFLLKESRTRVLGRLERRCSSDASRPPGILSVVVTTADVHPAVSSL